ncbi:MAG: aspartate/glutamate racemase family protein [Ferruginibacter sp.]
MKTIGLIGGSSWYSTIDYYRIINETVNLRTGNNSSAKILLYSVNFREIVELTEKGDWDGIAKILCDAARRLELAGAECLLLCANTMHIVAEEVQEAISIPLIHVADVTLKAILGKNYSGVLLLGTKYTMLGGFYSKRLGAHGIKTFIPEGKALEFINATIYNEFGKGIFLPATKMMYLDIIRDFIPMGAQGVILGCTEIPILLKQEDCSIPLFDTTQLHAVSGVDFAGW